jgi:hypothetical protein
MRRVSGPRSSTPGHHVERDVPALRFQLLPQPVVARQIAPAGAHADVGHAEIERPGDEAKSGHDAAV